MITHSTITYIGQVTMFAVLIIFISFLLLKPVGRLKNTLHCNYKRILNDNIIFGMMIIMPIAEN